MLSKVSTQVFSKSLSTIRCQSFKKVKSVPTEEFVVTQKTVQESKFNDVVIEVKQYNGEKSDRSLGTAKPVPISPLLGPYKILNPKMATKKYFWCSCGLSTSQPFCDGKHKGTSFEPYKFTVEEAVESMNLCGCKFTTNAPFCDEKTCKCLTSAKQ